MHISESHNIFFHSNEQSVLHIQCLDVLNVKEADGSYVFEGNLTNILKTKC